MEEENVFKDWIQKNQLKFSHHAVITMRKRGFKAGEIYYALKNKDMHFIQIHPPFTYRMEGKKLNEDPVFVILGHNRDNFYFHLVIAKTANGYRLVSVYKPNRDIFEEDFQTIKK